MSEEVSYCERLHKRFKLYGYKIDDHKLLTAEEERVLTGKVKRGCKRWKSKGRARVRLTPYAEKAVWEIIEHNLKLVISVVAEFYYGNSCFTFDDLIGFGIHGLWLACVHFDPSREVRFSTYATYWVKQVIRREMRRNSSLIRVPDDKDKVHLVPKVILSDGVFGSEDGDTRFIDTRPSSDPSPSDVIIRKEEAHRLRNLMRSVLDERERFVIRGRYWKKQTLDVLANELDLSRERVRQIQNEAKDKLRRKWTFS